MKIPRLFQYSLSGASILLLAAAAVYLGARTSAGQQPATSSMTCGQDKLPHPHPPLCLQASKVTVSGNTVTVVTDQSKFPASDPFANPPGTNLLPTVYTNAYDSTGTEVPNTLPSTPSVPYNLHDGEPTVKLINSGTGRPPGKDVPCPKPGTSQTISDCGDPTNTFSPQDDLRFECFNAILAGAKHKNDRIIGVAIAHALDILEGNPVPNRVYSGFPLLHYKAGEKVQKVDPVTRNVNIHQVWYDTHIESNTAYLDVRPVLNVPWTITYKVDVLNRGHDDFSPFAMFFDPTQQQPGSPPPPFLAMDQSFYNMEDGTETVFKIKMPPGKYFNLVYTWGWRAHPPRVQATENACKTIPLKPPDPKEDCATAENTLVSWERRIFFKDGKLDKDFAIKKLSKYSPEMIMWQALHDAQDALKARDYAKITELFRNEEGNPGVAWIAWDDWRDRTKLPRGLPKSVNDKIERDKESDLSLVYLNNTIYAHFSRGYRMNFPEWTQRGKTLKVKLYNGDYFPHGYQNVDFGGARGWENQFKSSVKTGGSGCWFTFGRVWWWMNIPMPAKELMTNDPGAIPGVITVKGADPMNPDVFGEEEVDITYNYDPSRRLRFYQFDPVHHDVAVFSVH
jgi:hypothetical protein